jgi:hypothetical protein
MPRLQFEADKSETHQGHYSSGYYMSQGDFHNICRWKKSLERWKDMFLVVILHVLDLQIKARYRQTFVWWTCSSCHTNKHLKRGPKLWRFLRRWFWANLTEELSDSCKSYKAWNRVGLPTEYVIKRKIIDKLSQTRLQSIRYVCKAWRTITIPLMTCEVVFFMEGGWWAPQVCSAEQLSKKRLISSKSQQLRKKN